MSYQGRHESVPLFTGRCYRVIPHSTDATDAEVCELRNTRPKRGDRALPCTGCLHPHAPGRRSET